MKVTKDTKLELFYDLTLNEWKQYEKIKIGISTSFGSFDINKFSFDISQKYYIKITENFESFEDALKSLPDYNYQILKFSGSLEWYLYHFGTKRAPGDQFTRTQVSPGSFAGWSKMASELNSSFLNFLKNMEKFYLNDSQIVIKINDEDIEIDFNDENGIKLIEDIYKLIKDEAKKNDGNLEELKVQISKMKDSISKLNDENERINKELFQNELQGILDSVISIAGPIGSAILATYKSIKLGVKSIEAKRKIEISEE